MLPCLGSTKQDIGNHFYPSAWPFLCQSFFSTGTEVLPPEVSVDGVALTAALSACETASGSAAAHGTNGQGGSDFFCG